MASTEHHALDHLADLTHAGARRAAAAFSQLANTPVEARAPVIRDGLSSRETPIGSDGGGRALDAADSATTGVFFEFEGCLDALVGILFPAAGGERLVRGVVGIATDELDAVIVESALMEVGNILASHVASGIADALHSRLLPSIPALAPDHADVEFEAWIERVVGPEAPRIEAGLALESGEIVGRLVIVPLGGRVDGRSGESSRAPSVC